jgi:hypothetical protein
MSRLSMHCGWLARSSGDSISPRLRRAALLGALVLAVSSPADGRADGTPLGPRPVGAYRIPDRPQLLFRRHGPKGKG